MNAGAAPATVYDTELRVLGAMPHHRNIVRLVAARIEPVPTALTTYLDDATTTARAWPNLPSMCTWLCVVWPPCAGGAWHGF